MLYFGFIDLEKTSALSCHFNKQQDMLLRNYEHFLQNYPKWLQYCTRQCSAAKVSCVKVNKIFHHLSTPTDNDIMSESFQCRTVGTMRVGSALPDFDRSVTHDFLKSEHVRLFRVLNRWSKLSEQKLRFFSKVKI